MSLKKMGKKTRMSDAYQATAQTLARRTAVVVYEADLSELPEQPNAIAYREGRMGVIVMSKTLGLPQYYERHLKSFLHECCHMRLHFKKLADYKDGKPVRPSDPNPKIEVEAKQLADAWWTLIEGNKDRYLIPFANKEMTWGGALVTGLADTLQNIEKGLKTRKGLKSVALRKAVDANVIWASETVGARGLRMITQELYRAIRKKAH